MTENELALREELRGYHDPDVCDRTDDDPPCALTDTEAAAAETVARIEAPWREWVIKHLYRRDPNGYVLCVDCGAEEGSFHLSDCNARALLQDTPAIDVISRRECFDLTLEAIRGALQGEPR